MASIDGAVVGLPEDGAAGHEGVGAGIGHGADVVDLDAAVDLQRDLAPLARAPRR
jgi:hypothetical protein